VKDNITGNYLDLAEQGKWNEALPLIEKIVEMNPGIHTSWFNYGVCLDELGRHDDAAKAFLRAYELNPDDYGAQFRVFRSYCLAENVDGFISFFEREMERTPEIYELIVQGELPDFDSMLGQEKVKRLLEYYRD